MVLLITTILFALMAFAPSSAPIKTENTRRAALGGSEQEIKDVATRFTENLLSYKAATIDDDIRSALADATTEFQTRPLAAFGGSDINQVKAEVKSGQASSSVDVKGTAITSRDDDTASALVVTYRKFDSNKRAPTEGLLVVELTMVNTGDGWKIDNAASPASAS